MTGKSRNGAVILSFVVTFGECVKRHADHGFCGGVHEQQEEIGQLKRWSNYLQVFSTCDDAQRIYSFKLQWSYVCSCTNSFLIQTRINHGYFIMCIKKYPRK